MPSGACSIEIVGQFLGDPRREEARMRIFEGAELLAQRREHVGMRMAKA